MKIKIPKPYWVIGSLAAASIIIVGGYNMIVASSNENNAIRTEQVDYSSEIEELKQRLTKAEEEIEILKEKSDFTESDDENKDQIINDLQTKVNSLNSTYKVQGVYKQLENITAKDNKQKELINEKEKLEKECKIYSDKIHKQKELEMEKGELEQQKLLLKKEIILLSTSPYIDVNEANKQIEELTARANSSTSDKEKQKYINEIESLKKEIEAYEKKRAKLDELENQFAELEKTIQEKDFDAQIAKFTISKEENERYIEIYSRIGQINTELLKY